MFAHARTREHYSYTSPALLPMAPLPKPTYKLGVNNPLFTPNLPGKFEIYQNAKNQFT